MNADEDDLCQAGAGGFTEALVPYAPVFCEVLVPGPPGPISLDDDSWFIVIEG